MDPARNLILAGLVVFVFPALVVILVTKKLIVKFFRGIKSEDEPANNQNGYDMEPWRQNETEHRATATGGQNDTAPPPAANPDMSSYAKYYAQHTDLGPEHSARQYV